MLRTLVSLALSATLMGACTPSPDGAAPSLPAGMLYAGAEQNGAEAVMQVGQVIRIELESIPTAGYVWQIDQLPGFLEHVGEATRPTDPDFQNQPGVTGGHHFMAFDLKATEPGTGTVRLIEGRPWELEAPDSSGPDAVWTLTVTVEPTR